MVLFEHFVLRVRICFPTNVYQILYPYPPLSWLILSQTLSVLASDIKTVWFEFSILSYAYVQVWTSLRCWNWQEKKQVCCEMFSWRVQICRWDPLACGEKQRKHSHSPNQLPSRRSHPVQSMPLFTHQPAAAPSSLSISLSFRHSYLAWSNYSCNTH